MPLPLPTRKEAFLVVSSILAFGLVWHLHLQKATRSSPRFALQHDDILPVESKPTASPLEADSASIELDNGVPETRVVEHVPGWTILEALYVMNGTFYIVSDDWRALPDVKMIISGTDGAEPGPSDIAFISRSDAQELFGSRASHIASESWICTDPPDLLVHRTFFSLFRTYASLDPGIDKQGFTSLPQPSRLWFTQTTTNTSRESLLTDLEPSFSKILFPALTVAYSEDWEDMRTMASPFVFDRVVLSDRRAATRHPDFASLPLDFAAPFSLRGSKYWWEPVRRNVLDFLLDDSTSAPEDTSKEVITYLVGNIRGQDHDRLVNALNGLEPNHEVNVVSLRELPIEERLRLALRTTIMIGASSSDLTHSIWMNPARSTLFEVFSEGAFDYKNEFPARALGIEYIAWSADSAIDLSAVQSTVEDTKPPGDISLDVEAFMEVLRTHLSSE